MGYNLTSRCLTCRESAFIFRGKEAESISIWTARHSGIGCTLEWAVDNTYSTPEWADEEPSFCLPTDLPTPFAVPKVEESHADR